MLSKEENELLTRVGPGTPMGTLLRRYWLPAFLSSELPQADGDPVRTRVLGEDLINFDTLQVVRMGACYELISEILKRWFDVELPQDPGYEALPSGHLDEFALRGVA